MMRIVEKKVSAGDREVFELDEFLSRPLYAFLAHHSGNGPRSSPVWFHWDGQAVWIIGGTTFPENLRREPRCAISIVDWNPATGLSQHIGLRGRAEILAFDPAVARTIFRKSFGPAEDGGTRDFARTSTVVQADCQGWVALDFCAARRQPRNSGARCYSEVSHDYRGKA